MASLKETEADLRLRVLLLVSDVVPDEDRVAAVEVLGAAGKLAIPLLLEKLEGEDIEFPAAHIETGPMNPGRPATMTTTAHFQIERVLYRIVSPKAQELKSSAPANDLDALRPITAPVAARTPLRYVDDWPAFWSAHKTESLEQMRAFAFDELERRWAALAQGQRPITTPTPSRSSTVRPHRDDAEARALRASFAQLRDAFDAARLRPADRAHALQVLKANKTSALQPHVALMLQALGS